MELLTEFVPSYWFPLGLTLVWFWNHVAGSLTTCTDSTSGTDYIYKYNLFLPIKKKIVDFILVINFYILILFCPFRNALISYSYILNVKSYVSLLFMLYVAFNFQILCYIFVRKNTLKVVWFFSCWKTWQKCLQWKTAKIFLVI